MWVLMLLSADICSDTAGLGLIVIASLHLLLIGFLIDDYNAILGLFAKIST